MVRCCEVCAVHLIYLVRTHLDYKTACISGKCCHINLVSTTISSWALTVRIANRASWALGARTFLWTQCWKVGSLTILNYFGLASINSRRASICSKISQVLWRSVIRAGGGAISVWKALLSRLIKIIVKCIVRSRTCWDQSTIDESYL